MVNEVQFLAGLALAALGLLFLRSARGSMIAIGAVLIIAGVIVIGRS